MKMSLGAVVVLVMGLVTPAWAGQSGNGGGAFICPDHSKSEFLDLYEARRPVTEAPPDSYIKPRPALNIPMSDAPVEDQIQAVFNKFKVNPLVYNFIVKTYQTVRSAKLIPIPEGQQLAWPTDEKNHYIKAGCSALAVMLFYDPASMEQDTESLKSLPNTDQAAAWVHETLYKYFRMTHMEFDSVRTRIAVGHLFSDESSDQIIKALFDLQLSLRKTHLGLYSGANGGAWFQYVLDGVPSTLWSFPRPVDIKYKISTRGQDVHHKNCILTRDGEGAYAFNLPDYGAGLNTYYSANEMIAQALSVDSVPFNICPLNISLTDIYGNTSTVVYDPANDLSTIWFGYPGAL